MRITDGGLVRELPIGLPGLIGWTIVTNAIESRTGESRTRPNRGLIVAILVGVLAIAFEAYGTATAMPAVAGQFHRLDLYDWAFTIFTIAQVFAIVIGGRMADRTGVVVPLVAGSVIFGIGLLGAGASPSMHFLLAMRGVQGFGGGALNVALMVLVAQAFGEEQRQRLMTAFSFCWVLPSFAGPPIAAAITEKLSWHWVFWGLLPILVAAVVLGAISLRRVELPHGAASFDDLDAPRGPDSRPVPIWAAGVGAGGAALLQWAGHRVDRIDWIVITVAVVGIAALVVALPALMPTGFFRLRPGLASVMPVRGLQSGAFMASESYLLLVLTQSRGFSLQHASYLLCLSAATWCLASWIQAQPWLRLRRDQIIALGAVINTAGLGAMLACVAIEGSPLVILIVGYALGGFGMGLVVASTSLAVMTLSHPAQLGRSTSSLQVAEGMGNSVIVGIAGSFYAALMGHSWQLVFGSVFVVAVTCSAASIISALRIGPVRNDVAGVGPQKSW